MQRTPRLRVTRVPVRTLSRATVEALWELYDAHYDHVCADAFARDLAAKDHVFLGRDAASGRIVGFSTSVIYRHRFGGRGVGIYFSGDTVIHPRYWGQRALHQAVYVALLGWKLRHPLTPLYWHLICSGYRTYLTLVRNFPTHWPHHARPTPAWEADLLDSICRARYGSAWDPARGVVSFGPVQPVVKRAVAPLTPELLALPEIAWFVRANPGGTRGDELAMIARVDGASTRAVLRRSLRGIRRRADRSARTAVHPSPSAG